MRIREKIGCIVEEAEGLPNLGMQFYNLYPNIDLENTTLIRFFLEILNHDSNLYSYYIGTPNGSYLIAIDLRLSDQTEAAYQPIPKNAVYLVLLSNQSNPNNGQIRAYFDLDFGLLETREFPKSYDPRTRPWYVGAEKTRSLYWTDPYIHYYSKKKLGLAASVPFYDKTGNLVAVIGADLYFSRFAKFLAEQALTQHGEAFILDGKGEVLLPQSPIYKIPKQAVSEAFQMIEKNKEGGFSYKSDGKTYLASSHPFPVSYNKHWSIVLIAPLSDYFADFLATQRQAVMLSLIILAIASFIAVLLSLHVSNSIVQLATEIDRIARLDLESKTRVPSRIEEIRLIDTAVASMRVALRSFAHYVPREVAKLLMRKEHEIALGGEKKMIAVFFTDIANFTSISETLPIEEVNVLLTEYFELLTKIIVDCGGTIDKYIGDSIMSIWGAPQDLPDFADRACTAALLCQKYLAALHEKRSKKGEPLFETRMGIRTGQAIVGNFGTSDRMNYSAIGDVVNTAARLQTLNKTYHTQIIIGEDTVLLAGPKFVVRPLEVVTVRGKTQKIKIFELVAKRGEEPEIEPTPDQLELCDSSLKAFTAFEKGDLSEAKKLFQAIHERFPHDYPTQLHIERLRQLDPEDL